MHRNIMRRFVPALALSLAACATRPVQPVVEQPKPVAPAPAKPRGIVGLSASELVGHFGNPALQVREGVGLKLQFRSTRCVLDAYLYPQSGTLRVTHIDTRSPSGLDIDQAACISALENPS